MPNSLEVFILFFIFSSCLSTSTIHGLGGLGINYGRVADNIPDPPNVVSLLRSINLTRVRIYDVDPTVLTAFADTNIELTVNLPNALIPQMTDPAQAQTWVQQNVQPFLPRTKITSIIVGNEILAGPDETLKPNLLPAMRSINRALLTLGLDNISVSTAHAYDIMANSYPPSAGSFRPELTEQLSNILSFHAETKTPFLINAYPFFAYKSVATILLVNVLFEPNPGFVDSGSNLHYDNMLYAQIDAVYAAMTRLGFPDLSIRVSETGWPSRGDRDEVGASKHNAGLYNGNLVKRVKQNQGTPAKPNVPLDVFIFALFNENLKPGPLSERNYGLYYPNAKPVYNCGLLPDGYVERDVWASWSTYMTFLILLIVPFFFSYLLNFVEGKKELGR